MPKIPFFTKPEPRGTEATSPWAIPFAGWKEILWRVKQNIADDHVGLVSAGVAFYGLIAIFPSLAALLSIAALFLDAGEIAARIGSVVAVLPTNAAEIIRAQVAELTSGSDAATGFAALFGFALALYGAMKGVRTLIEGMNIAYDEAETRSFFRLNATVFLLTAGLIVGVLSALLVIFVVPVILDYAGLSDIAERAVAILQWPVLAALTILGLAVIYRYGPDRADAKWVWISPGALLATALWIAGTAGFTLYAENFGNYNETYGTIGGVMALLAWLWLSSYIVILGAQLNAEVEYQTTRDTTTGAPKPPGLRGATVADTHPDGLFKRRKIAPAVASGQAPEPVTESELMRRGKLAAAFIVPMASVIALSQIDRLRRK